MRQERLAVAGRVMRIDAYAYQSPYKRRGCLPRAANPPLRFSLLLFFVEIGIKHSAQKTDPPLAATGRPVIFDSILADSQVAQRQVVDPKISSCLCHAHGFVRSAHDLDGDAGFTQDRQQLLQDIRCGGKVN